MPCHVPSATVPRGRLSPSRLKPPTVVAVLDLANPQERAAHDLLRRFCTGRWPMWRLLEMRREEHTLYAAVEWLRCKLPLRFSLAHLSLEKTAVHWRCYPSALEAHRALASRKVKAGAAAPAAASPAAF